MRSLLVVVGGSLGRAERDTGLEGSSYSPGMSHERVGEVGEYAVEQGVWISLREDAALVDVLVHHQRVGPGVRELHRSVKDAVDPAEVIEEQDGAWCGCREIEDEMR